MTGQPETPQPESPQAGVSKPDTPSAATPTRRRRRGLPVIAVLAGAAATAGSAFAPWWRRGYDDPLTGALRVSLNGTVVAGALVPLALVAAAGLGATLMSRGILRRVLAALTALAGLGQVVAAVVGAAADPSANFTAQLLRPAVPTSAPTLVIAIVALAGIGGVLVAGGALALALGPSPARRTAATYVTPAAQHDAARETAGGSTGPGTQTPTDGSQWWRSLDAGIDPTDEDGA